MVTEFEATESRYWVPKRHTLYHTALEGTVDIDRWNDICSLAVLVLAKLKRLAKRISWKNGYQICRSKSLTSSDDYDDHMHKQSIESIEENPPAPYEHERQVLTLLILLTLLTLQFVIMYTLPCRTFSSQR
jgi:hypothetical protein